MNDIIPVVSIIMPVYNCVSSVSHAIESVLAQTYNDWELLIIDDGSNDGSGSVCDEYSKIDSRINVVHIQNSGVSFARNLGIKLSKGKYIEFLDSDDFISNNTLQISLQEIEDNDLLIFSFEFLNANIKCSINSDNGVVINSKEELKEKFIDLDSRNLINPPWNKIFKKEIIEKFGMMFPTDLSLGEDLVFNLLYFKSCHKIKVIPNLFYHYSDGNSNSLSGKERHDYLEIQKRLKIEIDKYFDCAPVIVGYTSKRFSRQVITSIISLLHDKEKTLYVKQRIISYWMADLTFRNSLDYVEWESLNCSNLDIIAIKYRTVFAWNLLYFIRNSIRK